MDTENAVPAPAASRPEFVPVTFCSRGEAAGTQQLFQGHHTLLSSFILDFIRTAPSSPGDAAEGRAGAIHGASPGAVCILSFLRMIQPGGRRWELQQGPCPALPHLQLQQHPRDEPHSCWIPRVPPGAASSASSRAAFPPKSPRCCRGKPPEPVPGLEADPSAAFQGAGSL